MFILYHSFSSSHKIVSYRIGDLVNRIILIFLINYIKHRIIYVSIILTKTVWIWQALKPACGWINYSMNEDP